MTSSLQVKDQASACIGYTRAQFSMIPHSNNGSQSPELNSWSLIILGKTLFCLLLLTVQIFHSYRRNLFDPITAERRSRPENWTGTENCAGNLLDQRVFRIIGDEKRPSCQLLHYTTELAVTCLDTLHRSRRDDDKLHFLFMGDSRIRQQFYNFLRLIPDHDRRSKPSPIPLIYHDDIEVSSDILRLRVSFKWRPFVDDNVIETLRRWAISDRNEHPHLILLSMTLWHIVQIHSVVDHQFYQKKLAELGPILNRLSNFSDVIWLNQYPTADFYLGMPYGGASDSDVIVSDKLYHYNEAIRRILLEDRSSIRIWDSSNPLAEEYVRACAIIRRGHSGPSPFKDPDHSYVDCNDYIHTGYSALSQATQLLYNDICNNSI